MIALCSSKSVRYVLQENMPNWTLEITKFLDYIMVQAFYKADSIKK